MDSGSRLYRIKLESKWVAKLEDTRVYVDDDQTGKLPKGRYLQNEDPSASQESAWTDAGLWWGWRQAYWESRNKDGGLLYRVRLARDGHQGPSVNSGKAAISLIYWRKKEDGSEGVLDQYLGFCTVDPTNDRVRLMRLP